MKVILALAVVVMLAATAFGTICPTRYSPPPCIAQNITWVEYVDQTVEVVPLDVIDGNSTFGTIIPFRDPLYDASGTINIGRVQGICTNVGSADDGNSTLFECVYTFYLGGDSPSSSVNVAGQRRYNPDEETVDVLSITGGTGRFLAATGTVTTTTTPGSTISFRHLLSFYSGYQGGCCGG